MTFYRKYQLNLSISLECFLANQIQINCTHTQSDKMNILRGINTVQNVRHIIFRPNSFAIPLSTQRFYDTNSINQRYKTKVALTKLPAFENASMSRCINSNLIARYVSNQTITEQNNTLSTRLRHQIDPYMKLVRMDRPIGMCFSFSSVATFEPRGQQSENPPV